MTISLILAIILSFALFSIFRKIVDKMDGVDMEKNISKYMFCIFPIFTLATSIIDKLSSEYYFFVVMFCFFSCIAFTSKNKKTINKKN
jgi:hypothetical protein